MLKASDVAVRGILRQILHLPKDVPTATFHASTADGGLGILSLYAKVPLMRKARINSFANDSHPMFNNLVNELFVTTFLDRFVTPKISGIPIDMSASATPILGESLALFL